MNRIMKLSKKTNRIAKLIIAILLLFLFCSPEIYAFKFEDYDWGRSIGSIRDLIKSKGKRMLVSSGDRFLSYVDTILDEECRVTLEFTPKTKVLASIKINWSDKVTGEDVKKLLVSKYGQYQQPNVFVEEYFWYGGTQYDSIALNYDYAGTSLIYFGGRYQEQYEKEFKDLIDEEKSRF